MKRSYLFGPMAALCLLTGCQGNESTESVEEGAGIAKSAQLDNGTHGWLNYAFRFSEDDYLFAELLVMGSQTLGDLQANTEYWYVHTDHINLLGTQDLAVDVTYANTDPPENSGDQEFTQPVFATWNTFTSDPVSGGYLYDFDNRHVRIATDTRGITRVTWYQTLPSTSPSNIEVEELCEVGSGDVSIPYGEHGYYIDASIN